MLSPSYAGPSLLDEANAARERARHRSIAITIKSSRGRRADQINRPSADFPVIPADILKKGPPQPTPPVPTAVPMTSSQEGGSDSLDTVVSWRLAVHRRETSCGAAEFQIDRPTEDLSIAPVPALLVDCWCDDVAAGYQGSLVQWADENM